LVDEGEFELDGCETTEAALAATVVLGAVRDRRALQPPTTDQIDAPSTQSTR
jgi:hypothetical protein